MMHVPNHSMELTSACVPTMKIDGAQSRRQSYVI
jgi:hypothetical protein